MIEEVRLTLTALRTGPAPAQGDMTVLAVPDVPDAMLAIDSRRQPHLLLVLDDPTESAPTIDVGALEVGVRGLMVAGESRVVLDVACLFEAVADVFDHFIVAVLEQIHRDGRRPSEALDDVLAKWQQFLTPLRAPLGRDRQAALFGELLVLLDVVRADPERRIDCWVGPTGARHDFRRASGAIEVKTTRAHTARRVMIHGEDQLEPPDKGTLHLHVVRLEHVPDGGQSVASLVDEIMSLGVRAEAVFDALMNAGVPLTDLAATADTTFEILDRLTVPVDDALPRIVPATFATGARPAGVVELSYVIDLNHSLDRMLSDAQYEAIVGDLAAGN
jgi:hypothetical protein